MLDPEAEKRLTALGLTDCASLFAYVEAHGVGVVLYGPAKPNSISPRWECTWHEWQAAPGQPSPRSGIGYSDPQFPPQMLRDALADAVLGYIDVVDLWNGIRERAIASGGWVWGGNNDG